MNRDHKLPRIGLVNRKDFVLDRCRGQWVLHLGACGDLPFHQELSVTANVVGLDIDEQAIKEAKGSGVNNIIYGNVEDLDVLPVDANFDIILAGEIIEHLSNPGRFLDAVKKLFSPHTRMIITTPNAFCLHRWLYRLLAGAEHVNPEHTCYYSLITLEHLLIRHDFRIAGRYYWHSGLWFEKVYKWLPNHVASGLIFIVEGVTQQPSTVVGPSLF